MMNWVYGNRLFNTPAPIGYGVTIPQDLNPYFAMGDRFYTTNFGMQTQYNLFDPGYSPLTYNIAQNIPYYATTNPMLFGLTDGAGAVPGMVTPGNSTMSNIVKSRVAQQAPQTLAALEKNLQEALKNEKLTDEQKSRIQSKLDEVKNLKDEFQQALNNSEASAQDIYAIEAKLTQLKIDVAKLGQTLAEEVQNADNNKEASDETENTDSTSSSSKSKDTEYLKGTEFEGFDPETGKPTALGKAPEEGELLQTCRKFKEAVSARTCIFVSCTDNEKFEEVLSGINKSNVMEIMQYWDRLYNKDGNNSFMAAFLGDANYDQERTYGLQIMQALKERAVADGIYESLQGDFDAAFGELASNDVTESVLLEHFNNIYKAIADKEANNKTAIKDTIETKKAEKEQKETDKVTKAKEQFLTDMREIWKDEEAEVSEKVEYDKESGKFKIRIEGRDFYGADFNELAKNIEKAGHDPKQYLKKQKLDANA